MEKARILYVSQQMYPYIGETPQGIIERFLPQGIQEKGKEIRTFMPRYGSINERRHQLHEVIRLSGLNIIIDDVDHPLIIKVASIQQARMQIYFIDNEDYYNRKGILVDKDNKYFKDNEERAIFFSRGVLETIKKLSWSPDIIHCNGWISCITAFYASTIYRDNPLFTNTKMVISLHDDVEDAPIESDLYQKVKMRGIAEEALAPFKGQSSYHTLMKVAIDHSSGVAVGSENASQELIEYAKEKGKPILEYQSHDSYVDAYNDFYDSILNS